MVSSLCLEKNSDVTICRKKAQWLDQYYNLAETFMPEGNNFWEQAFRWRLAFKAQSYEKYFQPPEDAHFNYSLTATPDIVSDRFISISHIAAMTKDDKAKEREVRTAVKEITDRGDGRVWLDEHRGIFEHPLEAQVMICRRK